MTTRVTEWVEDHYLAVRHSRKAERGWMENKVMGKGVHVGVSEVAGDLSSSLGTVTVEGENPSFPTT